MKKTRITAMKTSEPVMTTKKRTIASIMMRKIAMETKHRTVTRTTTSRRATTP